MNSNKYLFLDIDSVLVTTKQHFGRYHKNYDGHPFDSKCVKVLNQIIEKVNPIIIISSDWKHFFNVLELNKIFVENGVNGVITDVTPSLWGGKEDRFNNLQQLEECRAAEILQYVKEHEITNWVAVDDLNLFPWIPINFVWCTHSTEGLKQSNVKEKIFKNLI